MEHREAKFRHLQDTADDCTVVSDCTVEEDDYSPSPSEAFLGPDDPLILCLCVCQNLVQALTMDNELQVF